METLPEGLTREWLQDNQVLAYRFKDFTRETVDAWVHTLTVDLEAWPANKPMRLILDARTQGKLVTPYAITQARKAANVRRVLPGRTAIIVSNRYAAQAISMGLQYLRNEHRERRIFSDEPSALQWLNMTMLAAGILAVRTNEPADGT